MSLNHHERGNNGPWNGRSGDYHDPPQVNASLSAAKKWWRDKGDAEYLYVFCPDDFTWEVHHLDE